MVCIEKSSKIGFFGDFGGVAKIFGGNPYRNAMTAELSLYNRFALKNLPTWGFWGFLGGGAKIFGGNPLVMQ